MYHVTHLMNQLVKGVLTVSTWFSETDFPGLEGKHGPVIRHPFPVAFHIHLHHGGEESIHFRKEISPI